MDSEFWAKMHGASTHLPLGLAWCSWLCGFAGYVRPKRADAPSLHAAGYWTILAAGIGVLGAVGSGLFLTKGEMLGHDLLRWHHLFVWPAYMLLTGAAVWRFFAGQVVPRRWLMGYLATTAVLALLLAGAGYWGGEMLLAN